MEENIKIIFLEKFIKANEQTIDFIKHREELTEQQIADKIRYFEELNEELKSQLKAELETARKD